MLVPESLGQINSITHQKDSHKDRQLSGQNQNRHLSLLQEEEADVLKAFEDIQRVDHLREIIKDKRLDGFSALIVAQTYIYFKTLGRTHFGNPKMANRAFLRLPVVLEIGKYLFNL